MREYLDAILEAHGLGRAGHVTRPADGCNNPIYVIDDRYVVRFDGLFSADETDPEITTRFAGEAWVYETLRKFDLPVPDVLALDDRRTVAPMPYMVMTYVPGRAAIESTALTARQRQAVARDVGQFLARMHNAMSFDQFGKWHQLQDGTHMAAWAEWPTSFLERYVDWSEELGGAASPDLVRDMRALVNAARPAFEQVTRGVIAHRDGHPGNMLQVDGRLSGVVDFEWWMAADPACDFAVDDQWEQFGAGCVDALYEGYTSIRPLTPGHAEKSRVYHLLRDFDDIVTRFAAGDRAASQAAARDLRTKLG
ncbi:MAG: phosphotransferase [Chloroflexi bacterium]|nr:phosphotransferase [Chloroflexota bacterium]